MRLISFTYQGRPGYGVIEGEQVRDLSAVAGAPVDLKSAITAGLQRLDPGAAPSIAVSDVELAPPIPNPGKILCVGLNYDAHRRETNRAEVAHPTIFTRFADTLTAHGGPIVKPRVSDQLDYEGELAVVIGRGGRAIPQAQALGHVAGYACFNEASVRDWQAHTHQYAPGKNFPSTGGFGPWLVTADELADPSTTSVTTRLNGAVVQSQPTAEMIFSVPVIIAYISAFTPLSPGDVICTGTPGGVGARREPPLWMKDGDVVEVEIPGVGLLRNTVRAQA